MISKSYQCVSFMPMFSYINSHLRDIDQNKGGKDVKCLLTFHKNSCLSFDYFFSATCVKEYRPFPQMWPIVLIIMYPCVENEQVMCTTKVYSYILQQKHVLTKIEIFKSAVLQG